MKTMLILDTRDKFITLSVVYWENDLPILRKYAMLSNWSNPYDGLSFQILIRSH